MAHLRTVNNSTHGSILTSLHKYVPIVENPSCLQTTLASRVLQESSHTVPHVLLLQSFTRPSYRFVPP